jgi:RimJ/RimL family protein N-acetyltransferase
MPELRTERLRLRPIAESDVDAWVGLRGDPRTRVYSRTGVPVPPEQARQELLAACTSWRELGYGHWVISDTTDSFLGVIVVQPGAHEPPEPELGWIVVPEAWGQGLATEAAGLVAADLLDRANVTHITSYLQAANTASRRVAEKLGMRLRERGTDSSGKALEVYELEAERAGARPRLETERCVLTPLELADVDEHAAASGRHDDAVRDTRLSNEHWQAHGFGHWAVRDLTSGAFLGVAELHFAGPGIEGIAANEVEAGWWITGSRRNEGLATECMRVAIRDVRQRAAVDHVAAYIDGTNPQSRRVATKLGFVVRGPGVGRFGEPMTVYALRVQRDD